MPANLPEIEGARQRQHCISVQTHPLRREGLQPEKSPGRSTMLAMRTVATLVALLSLTLFPSFVCAEDEAPAHNSTGCLFKPGPQSPKAKREFRRRHPCPATGKVRGACPGWQIDYAVPLCCGGKNQWSNMRWLSVVEHHTRYAGGVNCRGLHP